MSKFIHVTFVCLCMVCAVASYGKVSKPVKQFSHPQNVMVIDSIDYRNDLTRVYATLTGTPHTSNCISEITGSTDLDGVDFDRWYQFEDNGKINIEIDFPAMPATSPFYFNVRSARGQWRINVN